MRHFLLRVLFFTLGASLVPQNALSQEIANLVIKNAKGQVVFQTPISTSGFGIRFTHSVAKTPVEEWFRAEDHKLALFATRYVDVGAGLPNDAPEGAELFQKEGYFYLTGKAGHPLLVLERLEIRVGRLANHTLLLPKNPPEEGEGREIPFTSYAKAGDVLIFLFASP